MTKFFLRQIRPIRPNLLGSKNYYSHKADEDNKVVSIPSKNQVFGYEVMNDGRIFMNEDPEKFRKFEGEKSSMVGPGNYDLDKPEAWQKKGPEWSKLKTGKTASKKNKNDFSKSFDLGIRNIIKK